MNTLQRSIMTVAAVALSLMVSGCLEVQTTTQVNPDGTLLRTQILSGDSTEVWTHRFPTTIDNTWTVSVRRLEKGGFNRVATKLFRDAAEMNESFKDASSLSLRFHAVLEKRFLWFFTEFNYRETYAKYNPFEAIPLSEYVSPAAVEQFYRHEVNKEPYSTKGDSLAIEDAGKRWEEWRSRNMFESYYTELMKGLSALNEPSLPLSMVNARKEELYQKTEHWISGSGNMDTILALVQQVLKSPLVRQAARKNADGFASHKAKLAFVEEMLSTPHQMSIVMPGLILDTNGPTIEGNKVTWKEVTLFAYMTDYEIWVKSRVVNWWAVVVSAVVVLVAIVLAVGVGLRRRSHGFQRDGAERATGRR